MLEQFSRSHNIFGLTSTRIVDIIVWWSKSLAGPSCLGDLYGCRSLEFRNATLMPIVSLAPCSPRALARLMASSLFVSECLDGLAGGASFLGRLSPAEAARVRTGGRMV